MAQSIIQPSFAAGELSPSLYARVDLAKFHVGAALMRNFFADYRGGASSRAGTMYVGPGDDGTARLIPFQFSTLQAYALEFSDQAMRVVMNGALVTDHTYHIKSIANSLVPLVVNLSDSEAPYLINDGDLVFIDGIEDFITEEVDYPLNGRFFIARFPAPPVDPTHQSVLLYDLDGNPISEIAKFAFPPSGTLSRVYTLATPYAAADLALLKFTQSADTMTICHPSYAPQQLTRTDHDAWTITPTDFVPSAEPPVLGSATPNMTGDGTQYTYVVTAVMSNGTESLPSNVGTAANSKTLSTTAGANVLITWATVDGAVNYNVYRQAEAPGSAASPDQLYGFIGTTNGAATSFLDTNINPDFSRTPPQGFDPFDNDNNPGCTSYYQSRQAFAGSSAQPQTFWLSRTADFLNMGFSSPAQPSDAIVATIAAQQVNAIKHIVAMDSMILLTSSGAWKVDAGAAGGAVTPSAIEAVPQAYNGCSDVPPITINQDILYVQAKGAIVRDLAYNFYVKIYTGSDLTALSNHLFFGHQILEWAWAEEPFKIIWCVREDGELLTFTYLKEQDVYAWAHSDTQGQFKSVCSISEGQENAVYFIVLRYLQGRWRNCIERLASRSIGAVPEQGVVADWSKFWFVDCGLQFPLNFPQASISANTTTPSAGIVGATVVAGGANYTTRTVIAEAVISPGPTITIEDPTGSGAVLVPTVVGGVITGATALRLGINYTNPKIIVTDSTGEGAILSPTLSNDVQISADAEVFDFTQPGDLFIGGGGYGVVRYLIDTRHMVVNMIQQMANTFPVPAGAWSCTTPVSEVKGLDYLEGCTVTGLADGNVISPRVVSGGAITLDQPASAIVVGLPYVAQLESLDLDIPGEPTVQGKRKTIPAVTVRQQDTRGLKVGRSFNKMVEFKERSSEPMGWPPVAFTGDRRVVVEPKFDIPGRIFVQQDQPLPATVLAFIPEVAVGDTP